MTGIYKKSIAAAVFAAAVALLYFTVLLLEISLRNDNYFTGWVLLFVLSFLGLYGFFRRRLWFHAPRLFRLHLGFGLLAVILFFMHGDGVPQGYFALALWWLFIITFASGALGFVLQKVVARRQVHSPVVPYHHLARLRHALYTEAEQLLTSIAGEKFAEEFIVLWARGIVPFLYRPRNFFAHWMGSHAAVKNLMLKLDLIERTHGAHDKLIRLREILLEKDTLDEHWALFWLQRFWLYIHVPAFLLSVALVFTHIILVYNFGG